MVQVVMPDGSVKTVNSDIDPRAAGQKYGKEKIITGHISRHAGTQTSDIHKLIAARRKLEREAAERQRKADANAKACLKAGGEMGAEIAVGSLPYVGEAQDIAVIADKKAPFWQKVLSGVSLGIGMVAGGYGPNFGSIFRAGDKIGEAAKVGKAAEAVEKGRALWKLSRKTAGKTVSHSKFGTFYRSTNRQGDKLWWVKDTACHGGQGVKGGSAFKIYKETSKGLEWYKDATKYGDFISGKHKGDVGKFIPWKELVGK